MTELGSMFELRNTFQLEIFVIDVLNQTVHLGTPFQHPPSFDARKGIVGGGLGR